MLRYALACTLALWANLSVAVTDLDLDETFAGYGLTWDLLAAGDYGLRLYETRISAPPLVYTHYTLLSYQQPYVDGENIALIALTDTDGNYLSSDYFDTPINDMRDAVMDPASGLVYFFGGAQISGGYGYDMYVRCIDPSRDNGNCSGWPPDSGVRVAFDIGGNYADIATAVAIDPDGYLFVGGYATTGVGYDIALAKISLATGQPDYTFGTVGGSIVYNISGRSTSVDHNVTAMAVATTAGVKRVYLAGDYRSTTGDYDGFVMAIDPATGAEKHQPVYYELDNTGYMDDDVTALAALENGDVAFAGYSLTNNAGYPALLIGRMRFDGQSLGYDNAFCGGGLCVEDQGSGALGTRNVYPRAIAERPGNRDLVVSMSALHAQAFPPGPFEPCQIVEQFSRLATTRHARQIIQIPDDSNFTTTALTSAGMTVTADLVLLTGSMSTINNNTSGTYTSDTLAKMLADDSIFAGYFGD